MNPLLLTQDFRKTQRARCVPGAFFQDKGWWLPPTPEPDSARIALRLFPSLATAHPQLVGLARLSGNYDPRPIDLATARWEGLSSAERSAEYRRFDGVALEAVKYGITPHEFQCVDASYFIDRLGRGVGAYAGHEMGLGKTLLTCMVMGGWPSNFTLIVCPNSAKQDPWVRELGRFLPGLQLVVMGNGRAAVEASLADAKALGDAGTPFALITHYEALQVVDGPKKRGWKPLGQWDLVVLDEAHQVVGRKSKRASVIRRLPKAGVLALSGSVSTGQMENLFTMLQILRPKIYRSIHRDWLDKYAETADTGYAEEVLGPNPATLDEMRAELGEVLVVRRAKDHLDIPEAHRVDHTVDLYPDQVKAYRGLADKLLADLPDGQTIATTDGAALLSALRRVTGGVGGLRSAKHDRAMEIIQNAATSQILAFTWHKAAGAQLVERCHAAGVTAALVNGDVKSAERAERIEAFKRGDVQVLVATIATLGVAANLQCASVILMLEESFSPTDNDQAIGRAVRQGQTATVSVHTIRARNSVDGHVMESALSKQELRQLILGA